MIIDSLSTWHYCQKLNIPYDILTRECRCDEGECFNNVKYLATYLADKYNIESEIHLTIGGTFCTENCNLGMYHYILKDLTNNLFIDIQYRRWSFVSLHKWTLMDYNKEDTHLNEFPTYYLRQGKVKDIILSSLYIIKQLGEKGDFKSSNKAIKDRVLHLQHNPYFRKPMYGVSTLNI